MLIKGNYVSFNLLGSDGNKHKTEDFKGKVIVLYTYPKDLTPGCTAQACRFKDLNEEFFKSNAVVLGLNRDPINTHLIFIEKHELPFVLLSDQDGELLTALGALAENKLMRNTYIIDEEGRLEESFISVKASENPDNVLAYLNERKKNN